MMNKQLQKFDVQICSDLQKYSDVASLARCRIFYKGENRNGGFITDEFADKLLSTIPYTPIKGIYSVDDFTDHGTTNSQGRIYGVVPQDYNLKWEESLDDDGISRIYATVDVILYTEMYEEAKEIPEKSQSMELYPKSIQGKWEFVNGKKLFVYSDACFFGLQVLGDEVEPCFEGAAFYSLRDSFKELMDKIDSYSMNDDVQEDEEVKINFKLSDDQKFELIWSAINTNFNEEGNWEVEYGISAIYDDYALICSYETGKMERAYYTKNDEANTIEITNREECFIVDVTSAEKLALDAIQSMNGGNYECADATYNRGQEYNEEKISEFEQKITELEETNVTLTTERDEAEANHTLAVDGLNATIESLNGTIEELNSTIEANQTTIDGLNEYKLSIENQKKDEIIGKYVGKISDEVIDTFTQNKGEYDFQTLEEKLAFELVKAEPSIFSLNQGGFVPKDTPSEWAFLEKFENKE